MIQPKSIVQLMVQGPDERRNCYHLSLLSENPPAFINFEFTIHTEGRVADSSTLFWFRSRYDLLMPASMRWSRHGQELAIQSLHYQANSILARLA